MWELDCEGGWVPKNWCFWTEVLEKTLESPLDCKEIQSVHPKRNSPEYSLEGLMLKLKLQYFGHWCEELTHLKDPEAEKDWRQEEQGTTEDEVVGWHHQLNEHDSEEALELVMDMESWRATVNGVKRVGHDWMTDLN